MILLVTASSRAPEYAAALEQGTGQKTEVAGSGPQAVTRLRNAEYEALAIDQSLLETDFRALDTLLNHSGTAMPIYVNLSLHGSERVVREAQVALRRGEKEKRVALRTVERDLRNQLRGEVTGILLTSELALRHPAIPAEVAAKLQLVQDMAQKMRVCLHVI
jgi:CheY-like chemotaxis protein